MTVDRDPVNEWTFEPYNKDEKDYHVLYKGEPSKQFSLHLDGNRWRLNDVKNQPQYLDLGTSGKGKVLTLGVVDRARRLLHHALTAGYVDHIWTVCKPDGDEFLATSLDARFPTETIAHNKDTGRYFQRIRDESRSHIRWDSISLEEYYRRFDQYLDIKQRSDRKERLASKSRKTLGF